METARVARILDEMGTLLEVRGENPFRCRAYHNAAQALKGLPADLAEWLADGRLAPCRASARRSWARSPSW
jgi:DNA polymerase (family 10)